jgi:hypothetical protein
VVHRLPVERDLKRISRTHHSVYFYSFLGFYMYVCLSRFYYSVIDSDGEFLLIEAAECLPNWADPVNCHQRVAIRLKLNIYKKYFN